MKRPWVFLCAVLPLLVAGCLDFEEVTQPLDRPSPVYVLLGLHSVPSPEGAQVFLLYAQVVPGVDERGRVREFASDTLRIGEQSILPREVDRTGTLLYEAQIRPADSLTVRLPTVHDAPRLPTIEWQPVRSVSPDTITLGSEEDLVLRLRATSPTVDTLSHWLLEIRGGDGEFSLAQRGNPPSTLRVPAFMLPQPAGHTLFVMLNSNVTREYEAPGYLVRTSFGTILNWTVRVAAPVGG